ncbi:MAG: multicopper oxidase domain-containing protein [Rhodospirillales bacterium]
MAGTRAVPAGLPPKTTLKRIIENIPHDARKQTEGVSDMITRRTALTALLSAGTAATAATAGFLSGFPRLSFADDTGTPNELKIPALDTGTVRNGSRVFDLHLQQGSTQFLATGAPTPTLGINGGFLGPTLSMQNGENVVINVTNRIGEPSTLHWHGFHVPAKHDGGPHQVIENGATWSPAFEIKQKAATFWYHSHMHHKTGEQVYRGLAGLIVVEDAESLSLDLPKTYGVDDIPLIIQDRAFNRDGTFRYVSSMHDVMMGMQGDTILVNGTVNPFLHAKTQKIRFRILNGSNARFYTLAFSDGRRFQQIATDGSFLSGPVETDRIVLAPSERAQIVVDIGTDGRPLKLVSLPGETQGGGMMSAMANQRFDIIEIRPDAALKSSPAVPGKLTDLPRLRAQDAVKTRRFVLAMGMGPGMGGGGGGGGFTINGRSMDMKRIDERVKLGDTEIWEIKNDSPMTHPFHIHDIQFQILDRNGNPPAPGERGLKDTVRVHGGETVRVIARFEDYADPDHPYMYHCHILEHEDAGMMGQFVVV